MAAGKQRTAVYYSGHVQGVGFRYTTRQIASKYRVDGFVRNLFDGRVELVVEGLPGAVEPFLAEVAQRFVDQIDNSHLESGESTDEFSGFEIRH